MLTVITHAAAARIHAQFQLQIHLYLMTHRLAVVVVARGARPTRWSTAAAAATAHKQPHNDLVTQLSTVSTRSNARATTATCTTTTATCNNNKLRGEEINSLATIYSTRIDGHKLERLAHVTRERRESAQECRLCQAERQRERRVDREGEGGSVDRVVENKLRYDLIELGPLEKCCQSIECKKFKDLRLVI